MESQSTTDSLLQVVGTSAAVDIYASFKPNLSDEKLLKVAKTATSIFGVIIVLIASIMSLITIPLIVFLTAFTWGVMGSSLFILIYGKIIWKRATVLGAIGSSLGGFFSAVIGKVLYNSGILPFNEIYLSVGLAFVLLVVLSLLSKPQSKDSGI